MATRVSEFMREIVIELAVLQALKVAYADGVLQFNERERLERFLRDEVAGNIVAQGHLSRCLQEYTRMFQSDVNQAKRHAMGVKIPPLDVEEKQLILKAAIKVGLAKKVMSFVERDACKQTARQLGLDPQNYDL